MTATISIDAAVFRQAVQVTGAFLLLIMACLVNQGFTRVAHRIAAQKKKEKYERAKDLSLLPYDRTVGNLMEWALPFLGFFWMSMILTNGATVTAGWAYVVARAFYPFAAIYMRGVAGDGARPPILLATVPAYIALGFLAIPTIRAVL